MLASAVVRGWQAARGRYLCVIDADIGKLDDAKQILRDRLLPLDGEKGIDALDRFMFRNQPFADHIDGDFQRRRRRALAGAGL